MAATVEWWESVCQNLERDPKATTKLIEDFRESDQAFEASKSFLTAACSDKAKFFALSVLMASALKRWATLDSAQKRELRELMWNVLMGFHQAGAAPKFVMQKVMLDFVLVVKRGWHEYGQEEQRELLQSMLVFFGSMDSFAAGCRVLRTLVEEFSSSQSTDINLPYEFHRITHENFEGFGLAWVFNTCATACVQTLAQFLAMNGTTLSSDPASSMALEAVVECLKLLDALMHWKFGKLDALLTSRQLDKEITDSLLALPADWAPLFLQSNLVELVVNSYARVRQMALQAGGEGGAGGATAGSGNLSAAIASQGHSYQLTALLAEARGEVLNVMISLASVEKHIFRDAGEKLAFGQRIVAHVVVALESAASGAHVNSTVAAELRSLECRKLSQLTQKLFSNHPLLSLSQSPQFEALIMTLAKATFALAKESALLVQLPLCFLLRQNEQAIIQELNPYYANLVMRTRRANADGLWSDDQQEEECGIGMLLSGWRGDCILQLMESWSTILDDPLMYESAALVDTSFDQALDAAGNAEDARRRSQLNVQLKANFKCIAIDIFRQLFQSILSTNLYSSIASLHDDEYDDQEDIAERSIDDFLAGICAIGRSDVCSAIEYLVQVLQEPMDLAMQIASGSFQGDEKSLEIASMKILETWRICILFLCHLLDDTFSEHSSSSSSLSSTSSSSSSETPLVATFIIEASIFDSRFQRSFMTLLEVLMRLLQFELHLLRSSSGASAAAAAASSSPASAFARRLLSPLLLQSILKFFVVYCPRFVDASRELYNMFISERANVFFQLHGPDFSSYLSFLMGVMIECVGSFPYENDIVHTSAQLFIAMAKLPARVGTLVGDASIQRLYDLVLTPSATQQASPESISRLNSEGLADLSQALGWLGIKANNIDLLINFCWSLHAILSKIPASDFANRVVVIEQLVSCLRGLASCQSTSHRITHELFHAIFPLLQPAVDALAGSNDTLAKGNLLLLRDYAESQLSFLCKSHTVMLYRYAEHSIRLISRRLLQALPPSLSVSIMEQEVQFRNDVILIILQLLNHLSTKDFLLDDVEDPAAASVASISIDQIVSEALLFGLQVFIQILTPDILRSFPLTCDRYFSFVSFVMSAHEVAFAELLHARSDPKLLSTLVEHLLWGAGAIDSAAARMALHALQSIAEYHFRAVKGGREGLGQAVAGPVFRSALDRLLRMLLFPDLCEYGIFWDRLDSCANALVVLIALSLEQYNLTIQAILASQPAYIQSVLVNAFQQLSSARQVDFSRVDRPNRSLFVQNVRDFIVTVRPLLVFHEAKRPGAH